MTRSTLNNGLTIVSHAMPEVETVSLGIWIGAGSRSEQLTEHGVAHFLEHMAFKGTKRRSARQIVEEIEAVGGDLNASTSVDSTGYYARACGRDMPLALDILSDIILEPCFDGAELARERDVILQEIAASSDSPDDIVYDFISEAAFPDQPVGRTILGTAQSVVGFERDHLGTYLTTHYHAPNMVLAAAGAVDHDALVAEAERRLSGLSPEGTPLPQEAVYSGGRRQSDKPFEQTHLMIGLEAPAYHQPEYFMSQILAGALGGGMSSRLFQEVRERRGLCYSVYAFSTGLTDSGMFVIHAAGASEKAHELFSVIRDELDRAASGGFDQAELERVKAQMKMGLLAALESSSARAEQLARHVLFCGRVLPASELVERIEAVETADLQALLQKVLETPLSLATVGPVANLGRFETVADKFIVPASRAA
ncbi:M16 family metallopeptidase [Methyloceanibacter methanicus]|uniref:M16 family metallopeptidase n=1 Tax=Methyloceanibacter methanicus TaxID=1774968 RepID=UPI001FCCF8D9|nr:pitrilysin family protein [Methyloceanibacter methanicus]